MKFTVLLLILSTLGIFAKDVTKIHDWIQKNIQSLEKYIQETDMSSDMLLGISRNEQVKNYQNWIFSTNHKQHIELTDGQVIKTIAFGPESEYFTETTQNLVFLGTQIKDKEWIKIQMKKGNEDTQRIDMFTQENYQGVSLINSNNEGTLNRLLIVEKKNEIISSYEEHGKSIIYSQKHKNIYLILIVAIFKTENIWFIFHQCEQDLCFFLIYIKFIKKIQKL